ncbi:unnamed protein product [Cuscuta epithymum]|uniref:Uncharacterized protein n=1 Tax=Cuscuta epithymum TaxID=186058 RepID=A0AAV0DV63_9ASTE|nr:unnamed protein product [Cuscuta epithymum]
MHLSYEIVKFHLFSVLEFNWQIVYFRSQTGNLTYENDVLCIAEASLELLIRQRVVELDLVQMMKAWCNGTAATISNTHPRSLQPPPAVQPPPLPSTYLVAKVPSSRTATPPLILLHKMRPSIGHLGDLKWRLINGGAGNIIREQEQELRSWESNFGVYLGVKGGDMTILADLILESHDS